MGWKLGESGRKERRRSRAGSQRVHVGAGLAAVLVKLAEVCGGGFFSLLTPNFCLLYEILSDVTSYLTSRLATFFNAKIEMTGNGKEKGRNGGHGVVPSPFICPQQAWSEITPSFPPTSFDFRVSPLTQNRGLAVTTNWKELLRVLKLIYHPGDGMSCFSVTTYLPS